MLRHFARNAMLGIVLGIVLAACSPTVRADAAADDMADIRSVVEGQAAAISQGDAARAFARASPDIQARFKTPGAFMRMVEVGYAQLIRPQSFHILAVEADGDRAAVRAEVVARDGRIFQALYPLIRQPDGQWRIDGCYLKPAPGRAL